MFFAYEEIVLTRTTIAFLLEFKLEISLKSSIYYVELVFLVPRRFELPGAYCV